MNSFSFQATSLLVLFALVLGGCAKKDGPQTTLNRNSGASELGRTVPDPPPMVLIREKNFPP